MSGPRLKNSSSSPHETKFKKKKPCGGEAVISKRRLAAGNMVPVSTSSNLEAEKLKVGNLTG
jgi:hypothetical protein